MFAPGICSLSFPVFDARHGIPGKVNGEKFFAQKHYLLWQLRDLLSILNGSTVVKVNAPNFRVAFEHEISFTQMYDFLKSKKEYFYNRNIPHSSCLCEICENIVYISKGLNRDIKVQDP